VSLLTGRGTGPTPLTLSASESARQVRRTAKVVLARRSERRAAMGCMVLTGELAIVPPLLGVGDLQLA